MKMADDASAPTVTLRQQPFASAEKLQAVVAETYRTLKRCKADVQRSMALYLANRDTEFILFKPIKVRGAPPLPAPAKPFSSTCTPLRLSLYPLNSKMKCCGI